MKTLDFIPFGSQYYRAPTPLPADWEQDLVHMKQAGFNTIKIWAAWRWNHPEPGRFDFSDLHALMDLAQNAGLKVVINLILDGAPAWLFKLYPGCPMVTASGQVLTPVTTGYRQTGGVPAHCFHHEAAVAESVRFCEALGREFSGHPALAFWDLWNEPELTVGLLREPKIEDLVCHCPHSRSAFIRWLQKRYGDIATLNRSWWRNYSDWDELELPVQPHTYRDFIDWRTFFAETVRDELVRRKQAIRSVDADHAVMCHTVPPPIFPLASCGSDDWLLAAEGDFHGNSLGSDPFAADLMRSAARGKAVINAEIHAIPGGTFHRPQPIGLAEMKRHILVPLAHGIKGFLFWQYRAERLGAEAPAWGLTMPDGSPALWLEPVSRIARAILEESGFFLTAQPVQAKVAILCDPENQLFCWAGNLSGDLYARSLDGTYRALLKAGYTVDFLHPRDFRSGFAQGYSCIYLPVPYWLSPAVAEELEQYVVAGGAVVSELWLAAYDSKENLHSEVTPRMGLHRLFGVTEQLTWPQPSTFSAYDMWRVAGVSESGLHIQLSTPMGDLDEGDRVLVQWAVSEYTGEAGVLARLPNGQPCIVENRFGQGRAILAGAPLGYSAAHKEGAGAAKVLAGLVEQCAGAPDLEVSGLGRADVLVNGGKAFLVVSNESAEENTVRVKLSGSVSGFLGDEPLPKVTRDWLEFELPARAVEGYWVR